MEIKDLIKDCKSLNEIISSINREYDLDKKLGITADDRDWETPV